VSILHKHLILSVTLQGCFQGWRQVIRRFRMRFREESKSKPSCAKVWRDKTTERDPLFCPPRPHDIQASHPPHPRALTTVNHSHQEPLPRQLLLSPTTPPPEQSPVNKPFANRSQLRTVHHSRLLPFLCRQPDAGPARSPRFLGACDDTIQRNPIEHQRASFRELRQRIYLL
jgi:hypothetical protein